MKILLDTHTLFWALTEDPHISQKAADSYFQAKIIYIPTIVLLELLYLINKKGIFALFSKTLGKIKRDKQRFVVVSLDLSVVQAAAKLSSQLEMHDGIIVASAKLLKVTIVTKDKTIQEVYPNTIW